LADRKVAEKKKRAEELAKTNPKLLQKEEERERLQKIKKGQKKGAIKM
jgi:hypothetical protein